MSLIVTVSTPDGVVMASDSRTTLTIGATGSNQLIELSDSTYKTFLINDNVGVSTCGGASVNGKAISSHIENIRLQHGVESSDVASVANIISSYFNRIANCPEIIFHIAGYDIREGEKILSCKRIGVGAGKNYGKDLPINGVAWDGETSTMNRIIKAGYMVGPGNSLRLASIIVNKEVDGNIINEELRDRIVIPGYAPWHADLNVQWQFFSLQDGIDFAKYAIRTTIDTMRFQAVPKTVGGPIDVLVISPRGASWIARKELHA